MGNGDAFITADEIDADGNIGVVVGLPDDAVAGDTVVVNGVEQELTADDIAAGEATVKIPAPAEGESLDVTATIKDPAGNESPELTETVVTTPPKTPSIGLVTDSGEDPTDGITNDGTLAVDAKGETVQSVVATPADGSEPITIEPDVDGNYVLPEGEYSKVTVTTVDAAGNTNTAETGAITVDTIAPTIDADQSLSYEENQVQGAVIGTVVATDGGGIASYAITAGNESNYFAINSNGEIVLTAEGVAAAANDFETGPNSFDLTVQVTDVAGNISFEVIKLEVTDVGPEAPTLALENDTVGAGTTGSTSDGITNDGTVLVNGIESGATWEYNLGDGKGWQVGSGNTIELPTNSKQRGMEYNISVRQTVDGETSDVSESLNVIYDTTIPVVKQPVIGYSDETKKSSIIGYTEPNAFVSILVNGETKTGVADENGRFSIVVKDGKYAEGTKLNVQIKSTDLAGNTADLPTSFTFEVFGNKISGAGDANAKATEGNDSFSFDGFSGTLGNTILETKGGDDAVFINNHISTSAATTRVDTGDGNDFVSATSMYTTVGAENSILTGNGNDRVELTGYGLGARARAGITVANNSTIDLGAGDDELYLYGLVQKLGSYSPEVIGGTGVDTLTFTGLLKSPQDASYLKGFEVIDLGGKGNTININSASLNQNADTALTIDGQSYKGLFIEGSNGDKVDQTGLVVNSSVATPDGYTAYWNGSDTTHLLYVADTVVVI